MAAEGDAVPEAGVRVRLDGRASGDDITALRAWLEREKRISDEVVRIEERPRADQPEGQMGFGTEIVLVVAGSATSAVVTELVQYVRRVVRAWLENRGRVEGGEPPTPTVEPLDSDER